MNNEEQERPLIFGEVLFDHFPDGQRVLGGAPFNVAWNLQGLGLKPLFVSAVGDDGEGREVRSRMESWEMDTAGLQVAAGHPTGEVRVEMEAGEPHFHILDRQAYDEVQLPQIAIESDRRWSLFYVGSLAYRRETSRGTIEQLIDRIDAPRFVDVNMRPPWFEQQWADVLLHQAEWIKLNIHELSELAGVSCDNQQQMVDAVSILRSKHGARQFFITRGARGACGVDAAGEAVFVDSPPPQPMVDPVGAGDAFAAAAIVGIERGLPLDELLRTAVQYASKICSIRGATSTDRSLYQLPSAGR